MANKGPSARELKRQMRQFGLRAQDLRVAQGPATGRSASPLSLGGNSAGFGLDEILSNHIHSTASFAKGPMLQQRQQQQQQQHQPQGLSATAASQTLQLFGGELETAFLPPNPVKVPSLVQNSQNALHPELSYQFQDVEMVPNFGDAFAVAAQPAQGTVTNLGSGNYSLPMSVVSPQLGFEPSPSVQLPRIQQPYPQNIVGAAVGAPAASFPTLQLANNPNLQQPESLLSTDPGCNPNFQPQSQTSNCLGYNPNFQQHGLGYNPNLQPQSQLSTGVGYNPNLQQSSTGMGECQEMIQSPGSSGLYPGGWPFNYQSQFPIQQELMVMQPIPKQPHEIVDPSSRNAMMTTTFQHNNQQSASFQMGSFPRLAAQGFGNLQAPRFVPTSIYDPAFEQIGLPIDPHLRLFRRRNL